MPDWLAPTLSTHNCLALHKYAKGKDDNEYARGNNNDEYAEGDNDNECAKGNHDDKPLDNAGNYAYAKIMLQNSILYLP